MLTGSSVVTTVPTLQFIQASGLIVLVNKTDVLHSITDLVLTD